MWWSGRGAEGRAVASEASERMVAWTRECSLRDRMRDWSAVEGEAFEVGPCRASRTSGASRMRMTVEAVAEVMADSMARWMAANSRLGRGCACGDSLGGVVGAVVEECVMAGVRNAVLDGGPLVGKASLAVAIVLVGGA
jgi:hypothetical protein